MMSDEKMAQRQEQDSFQKRNDPDFFILRILQILAIPILTSNERNLSRKS